jgi:hypothetical protein
MKLAAWLKKKGLRKWREEITVTLSHSRYMFYPGQRSIAARLSRNLPRRHL